MRYLGPLSQRRLQPLFAADPFSGSFAVVELWNPGRYESETNMTPRNLPTGTTGPTSTAAAPAQLHNYIPFVILVLVAYALERYKGRILAAARRA